MASDVAMKPPRVLSIQSHVVHGHVGNSAAVFAMQRLGIEVLPLHTLQFSNHPGYGAFKGRVTSATELEAVLDGLEQGGFLDGIDAVLSGYLGKAETGFCVLEAVRRVKARNPHALYLCDPVMGDADDGVYVDDDVVRFFAQHALAAADILFPNRFELDLLADGAKGTLEESLRRLQQIGPKTIIVTSAHVETAAKPQVSTLLWQGNMLYEAKTPFLPLKANGTGDCVAALFLAHILQGRAAPEALSYTLSGLHAIIEATVTAGREELALVAAQDALAVPPLLFPVERITL
jgi:pyridoxine kinase